MMAEKTDALKNFEANLDPVTALLKLVTDDLKRSAASFEKSFSRHLKPPACNVKSIQRSVSKFTERMGSWKLTNRLAQDWIPVMLVTFTEAYLEEGLSELARRNPQLLKDVTGLDYSRIWQVDSVDELRTELRQQWANREIKGGPEKWVKLLKSLGVKSYNKNCVFYMRNLWDVRNLIVHSQGKVSPYYARQYPRPALKVGTRILVNENWLGKWIPALQEFVDPTDHFFAHYAIGRKSAGSPE